MRSREQVQQRGKQSARRLSDVIARNVALKTVENRETRSVLKLMHRRAGVHVTYSNFDSAALFYGGFDNGSILKTNQGTYEYRRFPPYSASQD